MDKIYEQLEKTIQMASASRHPENTIKLSLQMIDESLPKENNMLYRKRSVNLLQCCILFIAKGKEYEKERGKNTGALIWLLTRNDLAEILQKAMEKSPHDKKLLEKNYLLWSSHPDREQIRRSLILRLGLAD
ncbi:hypothetical protein AALA24_09855 [Anaerovoracaceae bacterium 42-11]